jgi:PIN domain nuclease of toxin-antitoxin system
VPSLAVCDAHALIWAAAGDLRSLGRGARRFFERVEEGRAALYVSTITLVEIGEAVRKGSVHLPRGFEAWGRALLGSGRYHAVDLTPEIVFRAQSLFAVRERGDRLVAATALTLDCPVITRDSAIARVPGLDVIW